MKQLIKRIAYCIGVFIFCLGLDGAFAVSTECENTVASLSGSLPLSRSIAGFSKSVRAQFIDRHKEVLEKELLRASRSHQSVAPILKKLAQEIIQKSNLKNTIAELPFEIVVEKSGSESIPNASMKAGVLLINTAALMRVESDDQLAAILAQQILHHSLKHDLRLIRTLNRPWNRFFLKRSTADALSAPNFFYEILRAQVERLKRGHYEEASLKTPLFLANAGYDPWALSEHILQVLADTMDVAPVIMNRHTRSLLYKRVTMLNIYLNKHKINHSENHPNTRSAQIKNLLQDLPD